MNGKGYNNNWPADIPQMIGQSMSYICGRLQKACEQASGQ